MPDAAGKQIVLVTALPNGKRLATLRSVERFEGGQVVLQTDREDRQDTLPARDCIAVEGADDLGLAVREVSLSGLTAGSEASEEDEPGVLEAFGVEPGAPFYLVRSADKERGNALADALREALGPDPIIAACRPHAAVRALDEDQMRACGWVRAEEARTDQAQKQRDDAPTEAAS
jgi:hypothetical protein